MKPVFLVGFMGSGKSTVGKKLATALNLNFLDIDTVFEEKYHMSIQAFFEKYGEPLFRKFEHEILLLTCTGQNVLVSTGGGTPCFGNSMELMRQHGLTVYLSMPPAALASRLLNAKRVRPLIQGMSETELLAFITNKLTEREAFYLKAHLIADAINFDIQGLANKIREYPNFDAKS